MSCLQPTVCTGPKKDGPTCEVCYLTGKVAYLEATIKRDMGGDYLSLQALYIQQLKEVKKLGQAFDDQSRELEIACEVMNPEQLTEFRHRAYPTLHPRK